MSKSNNTDALVKAISKPNKKKKPSQPKLKAAVLVVWESRPINWLAIGICYVSVAYSFYELAKYYVNVPEFNGIITFVAVLAVGSRAFKKK